MFVTLVLIALAEMHAHKHACTHARTHPRTHRRTCTHTHTRETFEGENFCEFWGFVPKFSVWNLGAWHLLAAQLVPPASTPRKFSARKSFCLSIHKSFLPQKFPTIWYLSIYIMYVYMYVYIYITIYHVMRERYNVPQCDIYTFEAISPTFTLDSSLHSNPPQPPLVPPWLSLSSCPISTPPLSFSGVTFPKRNKMAPSPTTISPAILPPTDVFKFKKTSTVPYFSLNLPIWNQEPNTSVACLPAQLQVGGQRVPLWNLQPPLVKCYTEPPLPLSKGH